MVTDRKGMTHYGKKPKSGRVFSPAQIDDAFRKTMGKDVPGTCISAEKHLRMIHPALYKKISGFRNTGINCDLDYIIRQVKNSRELWQEPLKTIVLNFLNTTEDEHNEKQGDNEDEQQ